jgi:hypothetical protein
MGLNLSGTALACFGVPFFTQHRNLTQLARVLVSFYQGVFNTLKITTTTHNDRVCISFNSKSAHSNPAIFLCMQKEDSLSFSTVLGSGGRGLSLLNKIRVDAKMVEIMIFMDFKCDLKITFDVI